jgi:hypothetical protein
MEELFCVIGISGASKTRLKHLHLEVFWTESGFQSVHYLVLDDFPLPLSSEWAAAFEKGEKDNWQDLDASSCS